MTTAGDTESTPPHHHPRPLLAPSDVESIASKLQEFAKEFKSPEFTDLVRRIDKTLLAPENSMASMDDNLNFSKVISSTDLLRTRRLALSRAAAHNPSAAANSKLPSPTSTASFMNATRVPSKPTLDAVARRSAIRVQPLSNHISESLNPASSESGPSENSPESAPPPKTSPESALSPEKNQLFVGTIPIPAAHDNMHAFDNSRRTTLPYHPPEKLDGETFVRPPWEVAAKGMARWQHTIVGYFLGKKPPFQVLSAFLKSIWQGVTDVKATVNGFFFVSFASSKAMHDVLEGGPWLHGGQPMFLERWSEGMTLEKKCHKAVPIWVRFRNLPGEYWTDEGLGWVASSVGHPLYPDAFTKSVARLDYARICVMVDLASGFKDRIFLLLPSADGSYGGTRKIDVEYEWRPPMCNQCKVFGHRTESCPKNIPTAPIPKPVHIYVPKKKEGEWETVRERRRKDKQPIRDEIPVTITGSQGGLKSNPFGVLTTLEVEKSELDESKGVTSDQPNELPPVLGEESDPMPPRQAECGTSKGPMKAALIIVDK